MDEQALAKIRWRCRRGMLELDLCLGRFFEFGFEQLTADEQASFEQLLECTDPDLYTWLIGSEQPDNLQLRLLCSKIRQYADHS